MRISIVLPAYNEEKYIESCLNSLTNQTISRCDYQIIVVDNGSKDSTVDIAKRFADRVIIYPEFNVGAVRNRGALEAEGEFLVFLDADCTVELDWLEKSIGLLEKMPNTALGAPLKVASDANWIEKYWLLPTESQQKELMGSCIAIRNRDFIKSNGFPENMTSGEDTLFSENLRKMGIEVKTSILNPIVHLGNSKSIKEFFFRQAWHGSSYRDLKLDAFKDVGFLLILISIFSATVLFPVFSICYFLIGVRFEMYFSLAAFFMPFLVFTAKRIYRSNHGILYYRHNFIYIFFLDVVYCFGRLYGFAFRRDRN